MIVMYNKIENNRNFYYHYDEKIEANEGTVPKRHYHKLFEIYFITEGTCTYFIDNKVYQLEPGDLILIPDGVIHNTKYRNSIHSRMLINCSHRHIPASVRPLLPSMLYLYRNPDIFDEIYDIFKKIEYEYEHQDKLTDDILCCYTHTLFFLLARNLNTRVQVSGGNDYVEQAIEYIQKNFTSEISLSEIAKMCSVSAEHFSRVFKKETGFGFNKYITLLRLQKAEAMLRQSDEISVTKVASECGFQDSNYFSVKFKGFYGISPKQMQLKNKRA